MGTLVAKKYATKLFVGAADHTYVECGTGARAWSCWGGKTGGTAFNHGIGSTERANAIAEADERANIGCYLVNGVCHQAANRILLAAGILVTRARGYQVSAAMFGPYGRPGMKRCKSPFLQYATITHDLRECAPPDPRAERPPMPPVSAAEHSYICTAKAAYARFHRFHAQEIGTVDIIKFQRVLFERNIGLRLGADFDASKVVHIQESIQIVQAHLIDALGRKEMPRVEFVILFNRLTIRLQNEMASLLSAQRYARLFDLGRDERVVLADPMGVAAAFGRNVAHAVYPDVQDL